MNRAGYICSTCSASAHPLKRSREAFPPGPFFVAEGPLLAALMLPMNRLKRRDNTTTPASRRAVEQTDAEDAREPNCRSTRLADRLPSEELFEA